MNEENEVRVTTWAWEKMHAYDDSIRFDSIRFELISSVHHLSKTWDGMGWDVTDDHTLSHTVAFHHTHREHPSDGCMHWRACIDNHRWVIMSDRVRSLGKRAQTKTNKLQTIGSTSGWRGVCVCVCVCVCVHGELLTCEWSVKLMNEDFMLVMLSVVGGSVCEWEWYDCSDDSTSCDADGCKSYC